METTIILGIYWDDGKENGNYYHIGVIYRGNVKENGNYYYWGFIGMMKKKMETTIVYWGYIAFRVLGSGFWVTPVSQDLWAQCFGCSDVGYSHFSMLVQDHKTSCIMNDALGRL